MLRRQCAFAVGRGANRGSFMAGAAGVFTDAQLMDIERGNALKLLPRLPS